MLAFIPDNYGYFATSIRNFIDSGHVIERTKEVKYFQEEIQGLHVTIV